MGIVFLLSLLALFKPEPGFGVAISTRITTMNREQGRVYTQHKCPSRKWDSFVLPNTYVLCSFIDTALSFSWLAQPGWTSQEHGIMF